PAAYYLRYFRGKNLVIINNESTQYDGEASLVLKTNFADTMEKVLNIIKQ
ncbi:MAG: NAD-dependent protein deacylase, partial [Fusobacterium periodonticum]|nr:NAD-dependent protein deacylase [Fusobacterium periodonticum]